VTGLMVEVGINGRLARIPYLLVGLGIVFGVCAWGFSDCGGPERFIHGLVDRSVRQRRKRAAVGSRHVRLRCTCARGALDYRVSMGEKYVAGAQWFAPREPQAFCAGDQARGSHTDGITERHLGSALNKGATLFSVLLSAGMPQTALAKISESKFLRRYVGRPYLFVNRWIWNHLPTSWASCHLVRAYGVHLHSLIQLRSTRRQYVGTFFLRNRPELGLLIRLLDQKPQGSTIDVTVLACSKGAEVYSISYGIRCVRPDLKVRLRALDIEKDVLEFAKGGVYSLGSYDSSGAPSPGSLAQGGNVATNTSRDQNASIFERMSKEEMEEMFDREGEQVKVKPRFREGITWHLGDAGDPDLVNVLGLQDIVVANRFLCHMHPEEAEACLRNLARLVKPGGYLFVSGVDLGVRSKVARELAWRPVTELVSEIHEGDPSLRRDWPLEYWGLEPLDQGRADWKMRYVSVFQCDGVF
jgi:chemotaxis methyl-accepting protein methylase